MNKYKILAIINFLLGISQITAPGILIAILIAFVIPNTTKIFLEMGKTPPSPTASYLAVGLVAVMGFINLFFGFKLFSGAKKTESYFRWGVVTAITTSILSAIFLGIGIVNYLVILPLYNLVDQF